MFIGVSSGGLVSGTWCAPPAKPDLWCSPANQTPVIAYEEARFRGGRLRRGYWPERRQNQINNVLAFRACSGARSPCGRGTNAMKAAAVEDWRGSWETRSLEHVNRPIDERAPWAIAGRWRRRRWRAGGAAVRRIEAEAVTEAVRSCACQRTAICRRPDAERALRAAAPSETWPTAAGILTSSAATLTRRGDGPAYLQDTEPWSPSLPEAGEEVQVLGLRRLCRRASGAAKGTDTSRKRRRI